MFKIVGCTLAFAFFISVVLSCLAYVFLSHDDGLVQISCMLLLVISTVPCAP